MKDSISSSLMSPDNAKRTAAEDKLLEKIKKSSKKKYLSKQEYDKLKQREAKLQQLTMMKLQGNSQSQIEPKPEQEQSNKIKPMADSKIKPMNDIDNFDNTRNNNIQIEKKQSLTNSKNHQIPLKERNIKIIDK